MKNITRSNTTTTANVKVYNEETDNIMTISAVIDGAHDSDSFKKEYAKVQSLPILKVFNVQTVEELRGMPENEFIAHGTVYAERSKVNRGMISKTISTNRYTVKVFDHNNDEMLETAVSADTEKAIAKNLPSNYQLLKVLKCEKVDSLVCMTVSDFMKYSKPMVDHFHYKK